MSIVSLTSISMMESDNWPVSMSIIRKSLIQCQLSISPKVNVALNNTNSKSARSLKYSPHSMALQFVERRNAIFFTTQQLSKLLLISKRSPKELDTIEMNNILKFQHNSWTINRDHIKFKFSFKLGWGFLWLMLESWSITPTEAHGKKAPTNKCKKYIGQNKSGRSGLCLATKPYIAILLLVLSSCGNDQALLELVLCLVPS